MTIWGPRNNSLDSMTSKIVAMVEPRVKSRDSPFKNSPAPFAELRNIDEGRENEDVYNNNNEDDDLVRGEIIRERLDLGPRNMPAKTENAVGVVRILPRGQLLAR